MAKATEASGASNVAQASPRRVINETDTDRIIEGDLKVSNLTVTGLLSAGPPLASRSFGHVEITSSVVVAVGTAGLALALVSGMAVTVPDVSVPCYVHARLNVSHSVANATIGATLARTDASPTLITHGLSLQYGFVGPTTGKTSIPVTARVPANTPCTVQLYMSGIPDGNVTVVATLGYAPSFMWGEYG